MIFIVFENTDHYKAIHDLAPKEKQKSTGQIFCWKFISFYFWVVFHCKDISYFVYAFTFGGILCCLQFWDVTNKVDMNIHEHMNELTSIQFSLSVMSNSLQHHWLQHAWLPCPSTTLEACSNSCPSSWWCHP